MRIAARVAVIVAAAVAGAALWTHLPRSSAAEPYRAPRTADDVPDLNGVWQALNTANYRHSSACGATRSRNHAGVATYGDSRPRPGDARRPARSLGARPRRGWRRPGWRRRGGGKRDPVPALGARAEEGERRQLAGARSGNQMLHARRSARHLHALSVSDTSGVEEDSDGLRIRGRDAHHSPRPGRRQPELDAGWAGRAAAGRARRSSSM